MATELEAQLRAVGNALDQNVQAVNVDEIVERAHTDVHARVPSVSQPNGLDVAARSPRRRGAVVLSAAAVLVVGLVVGMAMVVRTGSADETDTSSIAAGPNAVGETAAVPLAMFDPEAALSTRTALSMDERVAPTWLPDGYTYQYALDQPGKRYLQFADQAGGELSVAVFGDGAVAGDSVEINGRLWRVDNMNSTSVYSRGLTGPNVLVSATQLDDEPMTRVIESLVVGGADLAGPYALDPSGPYRQVASVESGSVGYVLGVQEVNGWTCNQLTTRISGETAGQGQSCGSPLRIDETSVSVLGLQTQPLDEGNISIAAYGFAGETVAEVAVLFSDNTTIRVAPAPSTDFANTGFWIAAATIRPAEFEPLSATTVQRVTAYDDSGKTLAEIASPFEPD